MNEKVNVSIVSGAEGAGLPLRVLVVDDDIEVATALSAFLAVTGIAADAVNDADTALARVSADPAITVVVSDLRMPGKDGLALASELRAGTAEARAVEVVMITGHGTSEVAVSAGRNSIFAFLQKPFRPRNFSEIVREAHAVAAARRHGAQTGGRSVMARATEPRPAVSPVSIIDAAVAASGLRGRPISVVVDTAADVAVDPSSLADALAALIAAAHAVAVPDAVLTVTAGDAHGEVSFSVTVARARNPVAFGITDRGITDRGITDRGNSAGLARAAGGRLQMSSEAGAEARAAIYVPAWPGAGE